MTEDKLRKLASDEAWARVKKHEIKTPKDLKKEDMEVIVATLPSVKIMWFEAGAVFGAKTIKGER